MASLTNEDYYKLVDALPYIDGIGPAEKVKVDTLIKQEMRTMPTSLADYEAKLPPLPASRIPDDALVAAELQRIEEGRQMHRLDMSRYKVEPPGEDAKAGVDEWNRALENAGAQSEHQQLRLVNLELQNKFGPKVWGALNAVLDKAVTETEERLKEVRARVDATNQARKLQHEAAGRELGGIQKRLAELEAEEATLRKAKAALEAEVEELRAQAGVTGGGAGQQGGSSGAAGGADGAGEEAGDGEAGGGPQAGENGGHDAA